MEEAISTLSEIIAKLTKRQLIKPWVTKDILKSIKIDFLSKDLQKKNGEYVEGANGPNATQSVRIYVVHVYGWVATENKSYFF